MALLTIDHQEGDGAAHRRWMARNPGGYSGQNFYRQLLMVTQETLLASGHGDGPWSLEEMRRARPAGFQVLCRNCQTAKGSEAGDCPCRTLETFDEVLAGCDDQLVSNVIRGISRRGPSSGPAASGRSWTQDEVDALADWLRDGVSTRDIAERLDRGVPAVIDKAKRCGLWDERGRR
jgi:hypothetical protein